MKGTSVVEWDSRRVTRSTVPRCEVQVVMITPGYALAPLTGTPGPANARENPGPYVIGGPPFIRPEVWITRPPSQPSPFCPYVVVREGGSLELLNRPAFCPVLMTRYGTSTVPGDQAGHS